MWLCIQNLILSLRWWWLFLYIAFETMRLHCINTLRSYATSIFAIIHKKKRERERQKNELLHSHTTANVMCSLNGFTRITLHSLRLCLAVSFSNIYVCLFAYVCTLWCRCQIKRSIPKWTTSKPISPWYSCARKFSNGFCKLNLIKLCACVHSFSCSISVCASLFHFRMNVCHFMNA